MKTGIELIAAERQRQIDAEGWTPEHDDEHDDNSLAWAAVCYLRESIHSRSGIPVLWPWEPADWKPKGKQQDLVRAGALIAAEIDRLRRLKEPK